MTKTGKKNNAFGNVYSKKSMRTACKTYRKLTASYD